MPPPYTLADGPPRYVALHAFAPVTATAPPVLNDVDGPPGAYEGIRLTRITGWYKTPDLVDNRAGRTFGIGEVVYPHRDLGVTRVYEGMVTARNHADLDALLWAMRTGFVAEDSEGTMTVTPWAAYADDPPIVWTFGARVLEFAPAEDPKWTEDQAFLTDTFTLSLRASDPRFYVGATAYP